MKYRLIAVTLLSALIFSAAPTPASAQIRFDITLEGPWILYVDKTLAPDKHPLLIAISPGGVSKKNDPTFFHILTVTSGDGYQVTAPRIYCLTFGSACGPVGESTAINYGTYPHTVTPLPVAAKSGWDWISKWDSPLYATAFILPMPKYFSTNGAWPMRFGTTYDSSGTGYNQREVHSIGVQLHYESENGAGYFDLLDCTPPNKFGSCPSATTVVGNTHLDNTGTLTIAMKSPDVDDPCDPHVRRAYPKTLALLDATNSTHAVIDPAIGIDKSLKPVYDKADATQNYGCLDNDLQNPGHPIAMNMQDTKPSWQESLEALITFIKDAMNPDSHRDPKLDDPAVLLLAIQDQARSLDRSLPRFSKFRVLAALVASSEARATKLLDAAKKFNDAGNGGQDKGANPTNNKFTLPNLITLETSFLSADSPTKNGNDCKAPIMMAQ